MADREKALDVLKVELQCVQRSSENACERNCQYCDLLLDTNEIIEAYNHVISTSPEEEAEASLRNLAASLEKEHAHIVDEKGVEYSAGMIRSIVEVLKAVRTARRVPDGC